MPRVHLLALVCAFLSTGSLPARSSDSVHCNPRSPAHTFIESLSRIETTYGTAGYVIDRPGHYLVARHLRASEVDFGILVESRGVTLDLAGHVVSAGARTQAVIGLRGEAQLLVRNGLLRAITDGINARANGKLVLDHVEIRHTRAMPGSHGVDTAGVEMTIASSSLSGASIAVSAVAPFEGTVRVFDSRVQGVLAGLELRGAGFGHVQGSSLTGQSALSIASSATVVDNLIRGTATIGGEGGWFQDNDLTAVWQDYALHLPGSAQILSGNRIHGGRLGALRLTGSRNRVSGNRIQTHGQGIVAAGESNLIERNRLNLFGDGCGIEFLTGETHVYRDNVIRTRGEAVCGEPNREAESAGEPEPFSAHVLPKPRLGVPCAPRDAVLLPGGTSWSGSGPIALDQPGYYLLTQDLELPDQSWIAVTAPGVTLDLGGHTLLCQTGDCARYVVEVTGGDFALLDGVLRGGDPALSVSGGGFLRAWNVAASCLASSSCFAIHARGLSDALIEESVFEAFESAGAVTASRAAIMGTRFSATERALSLNSAEASIEGSFLKADRPLSASGITGLNGNVIIGQRIDFPPGARVKHNLVSGEGASLSGNDITFEDNIVSLSEQMRIHGSAALSRNTYLLGMEVSAAGTNLMHDDFLVALRAEECGLRLQGCAAQQVVNTVVMNAAEGICGPAHQAGNVVPDSFCGNGVQGSGEVCDGQDPGLVVCDPAYTNACTVHCSTSCDAYSLSCPAP